MGRERPREPLALPAPTSEPDPANVSELEPGIPERRSLSDTGFLWDLGFPVRPEAGVWERKVRVCTTLWLRLGGQTTGTPSPGQAGVGGPCDSRRSGW